MSPKLPNLSDNRFRIIVSIAMFVVAVVLLAILLVLPMTGRVRDTRAKILENKAAIEAQVKQIGEFQAAEQKLVLIRDSLDRVLRLFPEREESVVLIETLENAVNRSEVAGAQLKLTDAQESGAAVSGPAVRNLRNIEEIPFTLKLNGQYRDFTDLMLYIENSPYIIEVREISFLSESLQNENGSISKTGFADGIFKGLFFIRQGNGQVQPQ